MEVQQPLRGGFVQAPLRSSAGRLLHPAETPPDHYITSHGADVQTCRKHEAARFIKAPVHTVQGWNVTLSPPVAEAEIHPKIKS